MLGLYQNNHSRFAHQNPYYPSINKRGRHLRARLWKRWRGIPPLRSRFEDLNCRYNFECREYELGSLAPSAYREDRAAHNNMTKIGARFRHIMLALMLDPPRLRNIENLAVARDLAKTQTTKDIEIIVGA